MLIFQIAQQSLLGDILSPFIRLFKFIGRLLIKILLLPYYIIKYLLLGVWKIISWLLPDFYEENLIHSFKGLFCAFKIFFIILTFLIIMVLLPLHFLPLLLSHGILATKFSYQFDLVQALILMVKTFTITEVLILGIALVGFLVSFTLAFVFITAYSPVKEFVEFASEIIADRLILILMFLFSLVIFGVLYLLLIGKIPL